MAASSSTPRREMSRLLRLNVEKSSLDNNRDLQTNGIELPEYAYMQRLDEIAARARQKLSDGQVFMTNLSDFPPVAFETSDVSFHARAEVRMNLDEIDATDSSYNVQYVEYQAHDIVQFTSTQFSRERLIVRGYQEIGIPTDMGKKDSILPLVFVCPLTPVVNIGATTVASLILRFLRSSKNETDYYEIAWLGIIFDDSLSTQPHRTTMLDVLEHVQNASKGRRPIKVVDELTQRTALLPYNAEQLAVFVSTKIEEVEKQRQHSIDYFPVVSIVRTDVPVRMHVKKPYAVYTLERENMVRELNVQDPITVQYYPEGKYVKISMTTTLSGIPLHASEGVFVGCLHYASSAATYIVVELSEQTVKILTFNTYPDIDYTVLYE